DVIHREADLAGQSDLTPHDVDADPLALGEEAVVVDEPLPVHVVDGVAVDREDLVTLDLADAGDPVVARHRRRRRLVRAEARRRLLDAQVPFQGTADRRRPAVADLRRLLGPRVPDAGHAAGEVDAHPYLRRRLSVEEDEGAFADLRRPPV